MELTAIGSVAVVVVRGELVRALERDGVPSGDGVESRGDLILDGGDAGHDGCGVAQARTRVDLGVAPVLGGSDTTRRTTRARRSTR